MSGTDVKQENEAKYLLRENGTEYLEEGFSTLYESIDDLIADVQENGKHIHQGYMSVGLGRALASELGVRIDFEAEEARLRNEDGVLTFTIKGKGGASRTEFERGVSQDIFDRYWNETEGQRVEKLRLKKKYGDYTAEFDYYLDERDLIVVEVEVPSPEELEALVPLGKNVTENTKYKNKNLAK